MCLHVHDTYTYKGLIPIALGRRHFTHRYVLLHNISKKIKNIHLINIVKKRFHQAVSKSDEPEHSEQFIIQVIHKLLDKEVPIHLLLDSGASGPILHEDFIRKNQLLVKKRKIPKQVKNSNEEPIPKAGTHYTQPTVLVIGQYAEDIVWQVEMIKSQIDGYLPVS